MKKVHNYSRRAISTLCALILILVSFCTIETPSFAAIVGSYGFEGLSIVSGRQSSNVSFNKNLTNVRTGESSVKFSSYSTPTNDVRLVQVRKLGESLRLNAGKTYKISWWYKVNSLDCSVKLCVYTAYIWNLLSDGKDPETGAEYRTPQNLSQECSLSSNTTNGWVKYEATFTASMSDPEYNYVAIGVQTDPQLEDGTSVNMEIYFDDVEIQEVVGPKEYSFENYTNIIHTSSKPSSLTSQSGIFLDTAEHHTGNYSIKFTSTGDTTARCFMIVDGTDKYKLAAGQAYRITFYYKIDTPIAKGKTAELIVGASDPANQYSRREQELVPSFRFSEATEGWEKGVVSFQTQFVNDDPNYNALVMGITTTSEAGWNLYIDDVFVEPIDKLVDPNAYSFEDYTAQINDNRTSATGIRLNTTEKRTGNQSIEYYNPNDNYTTPRTFLIEDGNKTALLESGEAYKVSFYYKIPQSFATGVTAKLMVFATDRNNVDDHTMYKIQENEPELIFTAATDGWVRASVSFNTKIMPGQPDYNALALGISATGDIGTSIYFDDVSVEITNPLPAAPLNMENAVYDFEQFGYRAGSEAMSSTGVTISGDYARSGKMALKYFVPEGTRNPDSVRHAMPNAVTKEGNDNRYRMEEGHVYLVSFWYYMVDAPKDIKITLWSSSTYAMDEKCFQLQTSRDLTLNSETPTGKWIKFSTAVYADFYNGNASNNYLMLGLEFSMSDSLYEGNAQTGDGVAYEPALYLDDFEVTHLDPNKVHLVLKSNIGPTHISGDKGANLLLPTDITYPNCIFDGWYLDEQYEQPMNDSEFTDNKVLIAKWNVSSLKQGFEQYQYTGVGSGYDQDIELYNQSTPGYDSKNVYSGNNSIHRIGKNPYAKRFTLMGSVTDKLTLGQTYKLSFYVKLESTQAEEYLPIEAMPLRVHDRTVANDGDYDEIIDICNLEKGYWYRVTTLIIMKEPYIAIRTPGDSSIYFDDFTFELASPNTVLEEEILVKIGGATDTIVKEDTDNNQNVIVDVNTDTYEDSIFYEDTDKDETPTISQNNENDKKPTENVKKPTESEKKPVPTDTMNVYWLLAAGVCALGAVLVTVLLIVKHSQKHNKSHLKGEM